MSEKPLTRVERLMMAMDRCVLARGAAEWTNGYRAAKGLLLSSDEDRRLWEKEQAQWREVERVERNFRKLAAKVLREGH